MLRGPRIVFFGTPDFAVASLDRLVTAGFNVVAAVTAPDRPAGRGLKMASSPVKLAAIRLGIPLLQPLKMRDPEFLRQLGSFQPDLQIVIAFRMLPQEVWAFPPLGTFNLHASLLPQYRGAAPINHAIINGETETGVTTFFINEKIDTGYILLQEHLAIGPDETAGELHDRLMVVGAGLVLTTVNGIINDTIKPLNQNQLTTTHPILMAAPKIFKDDCRVDWTQNVARIHNHIRGLSPYPGAFTELMLPGGEKTILRIYRTLPEQCNVDYPPARFITDGQRSLKVSVADGFLHLIELQLAGRKVMNIMEFLRGYGNLFAETGDS